MQRADFTALEAESWSGLGAPIGGPLLPPPFQLSERDKTEATAAIKRFAADRSTHRLMSDWFNEQPLAARRSDPGARMAAALGRYQRALNVSAAAIDPAWTRARQAGLIDAEGKPTTLRGLGALPLVILGAAAVIVGAWMTYAELVRLRQNEPTVERQRLENQRYQEELRRFINEGGPAPSAPFTPGPAQQPPKPPLIDASGGGLAILALAGVALFALAGGRKRR